jgi:hypothetical protein
MLEHAEKMTVSIRRMQETILAQKHAAADQRMREQGAKVVGEYEDDISMYGDDRQIQGFGGAEGKKRRGVCEGPPYAKWLSNLWTEGSASRSMP